MQRSNVPFNIRLLALTPDKLQGLKPVRSLDIFEGNTGNFHEDGLFSSSIFGKVGDPKRQTRYSYIDIKIPLFHPVIYRAFVSLKRIYAGIIDGSEYVIWNDQIGDFERSNVISGKTGFDYFAKHWKDIKFDDTKSTMREQNILLLKNFIDTAMTSKIIVMPAGLRDVEVGDDGRVQEDEINKIYRKLLSISNTISETAVKHNPDVINTARFNLQATFNELYDTIERVVEGKKKLLMGKWATRAIMNGTRNVITAMDTSVHYLGAPGTVGFNHTIIGLYQGMKMLLPVSQYLIRNGFLSKVFRSSDTPAVLVNKKTLHREEVRLHPSYFERWMTDEGIEKVITSFAEESIRDKPVEINGYYVGLIYKGPDMTFRFLQDIRDVPEGRHKDHVTPITLCELLYLSGYMKWNDYPMYGTRYPVTGVGSTYPSFMYLQTTVKSEKRRELGEAWDMLDDDHIAYHFPTHAPYINSMAPHSSKLQKLNADFDGDMMSANAGYSDETIQEAHDFLNSRRAYVGTDGQLISSTSVSTVNLVFHNFTGD